MLPQCVIKSADGYSGKTVSGRLGASGWAQNYTHSVKKLDLEALKGFRDRFDSPIRMKILSGSRITGHPKIQQKYGI